MLPTPSTLHTHQYNRLHGYETVFGEEKFIFNFDDGMNKCMEYNASPVHRNRALIKISADLPRSD